MPHQVGGAGAVVDQKAVGTGGKHVTPVTGVVVAVADPLAGFDTGWAAGAPVQRSSSRAGGGLMLTTLEQVVPDQVVWTGPVIVHCPVVAGDVDLAPLTRLVVAVGHTLTGADTAIRAAPRRAAHAAGAARVVALLEAVIPEETRGTGPVVHKDTVRAGGIKLTAGTGGVVTVPEPLTRLDAPSYSPELLIGRDYTRDVLGAGR